MAIIMSGQKRRQRVPIRIKNNQTIKFENFGSQACGESADRINVLVVRFSQRMGSLPFFEFIDGAERNAPSLCKFALRPAWPSHVLLGTAPVISGILLRADGTNRRRARGCRTIEGPDLAQIVPSAAHWRNREHRELLPSGLASPVSVNPSEEYRMNCT
jgi:hypothetical protein